MISLLKSHETIGVLISVGFGVILRILLLRTDLRQYPTYPHGRVIHISLGVIAAAMGAVAVPALLGKDYTAVTFLSLAAQQFREVRNMEAQQSGESGCDGVGSPGLFYIEGIAMAFEGRNYLIMFAACDRFPHQHCFYLVLGNSSRDHRPHHRSQAEIRQRIGGDCRGPAWGSAGGWT